MQALAVFRSLRNPVFAQLYAAHAVSLLGDALTWVALALLAFELVGEGAGVVLGMALTLRVTAFVIFSPLGGALADRINRKTVMVVADLARVAVIGLMFFVTEPWQVYVLIFLLSMGTAFFTPAFQASIPQVTGPKDYPQAIALSGATTELFGVVGPAIAGALAVLFGVRPLFWIHAAAFLISALLIMTLATRLYVDKPDGKHSTWADIKLGTFRLWSDQPVRYALLLELVAAISGAWILVNTVVQVRGQLEYGEAAFGWVMAVFGIGATLAALALGALDKRLPRTTFILIGAALTTVAIAPANMVALAPLMMLWFVAGIGQNWVNLPALTLIADRIPEALQGRVYGAHFAWSHLWWVFSYPLAGWLGSSLPESSFLWGGLIGLGLLAVVYLGFRPR
ncbi:MFS transporter [uncultured Meiothermus sp.]|jgi:NRE family putative nickel resistance protein-like MFS transporter|uniref:MFS transporter n=1 Tax=uncultured Meiothermus sp. TaxID=157471 RepID=UPI0026266389|nr:MFS transporter [uncultured Meiothermus sp.]